MTHTDAPPDCPPFPQLVEWFDGLLGAHDAERTERHLDSCVHCRQVLLDWSEQVVAAPPTAPAATSDECLDAETLVAYGAAPTTLAPATVAGIERHLRHCAHCAHSLRHMMNLHRQMERAAPAGGAAVAVTEPVRVAAPHPTVRIAGVASQWWKHVHALFTPAMWPRAALAAVGVLVLAIGLSRFVVPMVSNQQNRVRSAERVATVEVLVDTAGHARPALDEPIVSQLARGTHARWLETAGEWTRIELADGRRVWVLSRSVTAVRDK